jgi:hypothetical protein
MADDFSICWRFFEGCEEVFAGAHAVSVQKREDQKTGPKNSTEKAERQPRAAFPSISLKCEALLLQRRYSFIEFTEQIL